MQTPNEIKESLEKRIHTINNEILNITSENINENKKFNKQSKLINERQRLVNNLEKLNEIVRKYHTTANSLVKEVAKLNETSKNVFKKKSKTTSTFFNRIFGRSKNVGHSEAKINMSHISNTNNMTHISNTNNITNSANNTNNNSPSFNDAISKVKNEIKILKQEKTEYHFTTYPKEKELQKLIQLQKTLENSKNIEKYEKEIEKLQLALNNLKHKESKYRFTDFPEEDQQKIFNLTNQLSIKQNIFKLQGQLLNQRSYINTLPNNNNTNTKFEEQLKLNEIKGEISKLKSHESQLKRELNKEKGGKLHNLHQRYGK